MTLERRYLLNRDVQSGDSGTRRVELARNGFVSAIGLRIECTNGATSGFERVHDAVDRVELIGDGSDVLFSLTGPELHRWQQVWQRRPAAEVWDEQGGNVQELFAVIPFGRFLGDPELALNLANYRRVELTVEFSPTIAATSFATGTFTITAIEYSWREGQQPAGVRGFLRTRQIRDFTSAASGDEEIELDRRYPIMGALVYAREAGVADGTDITTVEVQEDDGRVIPYTGRWLDVQAENQEMLDLESEVSGIALRSDADNIDTLLARILSAHVQVSEDLASAADQHYARIASITGDRIALTVYTLEGSATWAAMAVYATDIAIHVRARGIGIGNAVFIPLARPGDIANPYPAPEKSKVELVLTQGGAGATVRASVQELVPA